MSAPKPGGDDRRAAAHAGILRSRHLFVMIGAACIGLFLLLPGELRPVTRLLVAWCVFVLTYLTAVFIGMRRASAHAIRRRAALYDVSDGAMLVLATGAAVASLAAAVAELAYSKTVSSAYAHLALTVATVLLSWFFVHVMFALHYAHTFYCDRTARAGPDLRFPDAVSAPRYGEFLYFSFVIGCACATADVDICSPAMRRVALVHGVVSFFFNVSIVGLTINIAAGLLG